MYITNIKKTKHNKTKSGNSIWWLLSEKIGVPNFELRYFEIKKDMHTSCASHPWEHEIFIVKGMGLLKGKDLEGRTFERELKPQDAAYIAPNETHQLFNCGREAFGFVCVIPKGCER